MDAIIDVVGAVIGITALGIQKIFCSPIHVGCGTIKCAHGTLPVPAPATAELIKNTPAYSSGVEGELLTPTGAAILSTLASGFGPMPAMTIRQIGYGAGTADPDIPNLLRVIIGASWNGNGRHQTKHSHED
jgi:pyridinium-3,5-bisthiocarboxylic acid mononucleotide nickel chelatase